MRTSPARGPCAGAAPRTRVEAARPSPRRDRESSSTTLSESIALGRAASVSAASPEQARIGVRLHVLRHAERDRGVALRVQVDQQGAATGLRDTRGEVDRGRGLPHAALLVRHCIDRRHSLRSDDTGGSGRNRRPGRGSRTIAWFGTEPSSPARDGIGSGPNGLGARIRLAERLPVRHPGPAWETPADRVSPSR